MKLRYRQAFELAGKASFIDTKSLARKFQNLWRTGEAFAAAVQSSIYIEAGELQNVRKFIRLFAV